MKLSLAWIFDHIECDRKQVDVNALIIKFNQSVAEIESSACDVVDINLFFIVSIISNTELCLVVHCVENNKTFELPIRADYFVGNFYMVKQDSTLFRWATVLDIGLEKDGFIPAVFVNDDMLTGAWKNNIDIDDIIIDIDNKSITHRPDLWGHRGVAREIAALLGCKLIDESLLLYDVRKIIVDNEYRATDDVPFSMKLQTEKCDRIAAIYLNRIENRSCSIFQALRLARVGMRPINVLVDTTNYVMMDIGQPMHAFDAKLFIGNYFVVRMGLDNEKMELLDGSLVTISHDDIVIANQKGPLSLAGVMGGRLSSISSLTDSLIIEAAHFDATTIRLTALRYKQRTEASSRFEKNIDPVANEIALRRYMKILHNMNISFSASTMISLGAIPYKKNIAVSHVFIENRLGLLIDSFDVIDRLKSIGFNVNVTNVNSEIMYNIDVPSFRSSKDITIPEDIVEEVGRLLGYSLLPITLPNRVMSFVNNEPVMRIRLLKQLFMSVAHGVEVDNYSFFDNAFLKHIQYVVDDVISIANPLSFDRTHLVNSLVPHLLQNVMNALSVRDAGMFFECARIWNIDKITNEHVVEKKICTSIFFDKNGVDFYEVKLMITSILHGLSINAIEWKLSNNIRPWSSKYQTVDIYYKDRVIGVLGRLKNILQMRLDSVDAIICELDIDFITQYKANKKQFLPLPKYQSTSLDVSVLVENNVTVSELMNVIYQVDKRVFDVIFIDMFIKEEWESQKSITLRFLVRDEFKTLEKIDIDTCYQNVISQLIAYGATIR